MTILQAAGIRYPKDYTLINLSLITSVTTLDMRNMLTELSYSEDLFNNIVSGYLMVVDAAGYIELLNLTGNEYILMSFTKSNDDFNKIEKLLRVYKVAKRKPEGDGNSESYSLYFCSDEMLLSEQYKVCKAYKNTAIYSIVTDILQKDLKVPSYKISLIESTFGSYDFVIPNLRPFDAINWLSTYARPSPDKPGADMLLYEDKFGFNFRSLQSIFQQQTYRVYAYNPKNLAQESINDDVYNVTTYEVLDSYDALRGINSGMFANRLLSVDPLLRKINTTDFNYYNYTGTTLNKFNITNNLVNRKGQSVYQTPQSVLKLIFSNSNQRTNTIIQNNVDTVGNDIFAETYIPYRTAQMSLVNYNRIRISVPGDPGLTVGLVIGFDLLSKDPNGKSGDPNLAGRYIVTAVRHMITMNEYKTVLEIAKDSVANQYADPNSQDSNWSKIVNGDASGVPS